MSTETMLATIFCVGGLLCWGLGVAIGYLWGVRRTESRLRQHLHQEKAVGDDGEE